MRDLAHEIDGEDVGRAGGHEQRAGDAACRETRPHDVATHLVGGRVVGLGVIDRRQVHDDRIHGAGAARSVRRREGREHHIGERRGIAEHQRALAQRTHQQERDATAEPGLLIAQRKHEGAADQPDRVAGKAGEGPFHRFIDDPEAGLGNFFRAEERELREEGGQRDRDEAHGGRRIGLKDQRGDDAAEECEEIPGMLGEACGRRNQGQRDGNGSRNDEPPCRDFLAGR